MNVFGGWSGIPREDEDAASIVAAKRSPMFVFNTYNEECSAYPCWVFKSTELEHNLWHIRSAHAFPRSFKIRMGIYDPNLQLKITRYTTTGVSKGLLFSSLVL